MEGEKPIFSPSILYQMIKSEFQLPSDILSYDNFHDYQVRFFPLFFHIYILIII